MTIAKAVRIPVGPFDTHCLLAGDETSPTLLLLHDGAWGGCGHVTWGSMISSLASRYRVIAPDMLGFGSTDKAVFLDRSPYAFRIRHLIALLDTLGVAEKVHVVGNSFGGSVALRMLEDHSERILSVTSINGTGGPWRTELAKAELGRWDGTRSDLERIFDMVLDRKDGFDLNAHLDSRYQSAVAHGHYRAMMAPTLSQPSGLSQTVTDAWPESLQNTAVPVFLIGGLRDPLVEKCWIDMLSVHLSHARSLWMDSRHCPNIDDPDATAEVLLDRLGA